MSLAVDIRHRLGAFTLDAAFTAGPGVTALFGRSGAGKTSLVNIIGGLIRPERGRVVADGATLVDTERRIFLPKHRRRLGYVFQEGRLFPHLTVRQNLLYGRWFAPRRAPRDSLERVVALLGIGHLLERRPGLLSGGEKQRVAIGRALLAAPRLLLMDEPLAALDVERKAELLPYIERLRDDLQIPIVYVSHVVEEVARLATTLVILEAGRVVTAGPAPEVLSRLDLVPLAGGEEAGTILEARVEGHDAAADLTLLSARAGLIRVPRLDLPQGAVLRIRIRARDVLLATAPPVQISALNILPGTVAALSQPDPAVMEVRVDCAGDPVIARITRHSVAALGLAPGRPVYAVVKSIAFDRHVVSGARPASAGPATQA